MLKSRKTGILLSYLQLGLNIVCGLVLSSFLLKTLGDTEFGLYQTIASFANYLVMLEFGTGAVMTRNISLSRSKGKESINRNYSTVCLISYALSLVILLAAFAFYMSIGSIYKNSMSPEQIAYAKRIFVLLIGYIIVSYLEQNYSGFLLAVEEYAFSKIVSIVRISLRTLMLLFIVSAKKYAICVAAVDLALGVASLAVSWAYCKKRYAVSVKLEDFDKDVFKMSVPLCMALLLQTVTNQANNSVDKFVIGIMMTMESVAIYSVAQYVFTMFSSVGTVTISMYMPEVAKNIQSGKCGMELTKTLVPACRLSAVICGSLMCGFFAVGKQFVTLLYGADKAVAWTYTLLIIVPQFLNLTNAVIIDVLDVLNKRIARSLALLGTTAANIVLTVILIKPFGILGAVAATSVTLLIGNVIVMNVYYRKKLDIQVGYLFAKTYKGILPYQMIAAVVAYFIAAAIPNDLAGFFVGGLGYVLLSFLPMYFFGLDADEKNRVKKTVGKVLRKV